MFSFINRSITVTLALLIGLPIIALFAYIAAGFAQGLFGGPIWLWMAIIFIFGVGLAAEESKKIGNNQSNN
jgi:hypothetical protein